MAKLDRLQKEVEKDFESMDRSEFSTKRDGQIATSVQ